eukprot:PhF_6_TR1490/c0_g1_i1/m.2692/K15628/PXA; ATP-binding cassette, subfamily D (ALD), peroxisomal long-chain fatty acid import protein
MKNLRSILGILGALVLFLYHRQQLVVFHRNIQDVRTIDEASITLGAFGALRRMIRIALPSVWSKEGMGTTIFVLLFGIKAFLSVQRSRADGAVLETFIRKGNLSAALLNLLGLSLINAAVGGAIEHMRFYLIAVYRERLTKYFHKRFYERYTYYYGTVLDDRIVGSDTYITNYCHEFAEHFAEMPYYFLMPFFEAMTSLYVMGKEIGVASTSQIISVVLLSLGMLQYLTPPFGKIHAALLNREEDFRRLHTEVMANVEQVALHNGGSFMRNRLDSAFTSVRTVMQHMALAKGHFQMLEMGISSLWDVVGFIACQNVKHETSSNVLTTIVVQRRVISDFHNAIKALVINIKELSHMSEFTDKLAHFDQVIDELVKGEFQKNPDPRFVLDDGSVQIPSKEDYTGPADSPASPQSSFFLEPEKTNVTPLIEFKDVDVSTPNGVLLVSGLNLHMHLDDNWVITGPNGCGKSSILRVLSGIWLPSRGIVCTQPIVDLYFLPQQAFMASNCTLLEQISFPESDVVPCADLVQRVREALTLATGLGIITEVFGDWDHPIIGQNLETCDRTFEWNSLSGGQQQKMSLTRLFFHSRKSQERGRVPVAVMDESTSQMDQEAESILFANLKAKHIQLVSSTHRPEVVKYHENRLLLTRHASKWSIRTR